MSLDGHALVGIKLFYRVFLMFGGEGTQISVCQTKICIPYFLVNREIDFIHNHFKMGSVMVYRAIQLQVAS